MDLELADAEEIQIQDVLAAHLDGALEGVQTALPGVVVRVDGERLAVRPTGGRRSVDPDTGDATYSRYAVVEGVPVCYPQAGPYGITFPISVGDEVLLVFASHSLDSWEVGRDGEAPLDPRRHHLTDAIAIPGVSRKRRLAVASGATTIHGPDVRLGGADAALRVARDVDLDQLAAILTGAPDGLGYGSAVKTALSSTGWPNCASIVRAK